MIPNRIAEIREQRRLSQTALAKKIGRGVKQATISRLEAGKMALTSKYMEMLSEALEVEPGDLLPQGKYVEWIPVTGRVEVHSNKSVHLFGHENIYHVPFARDDRFKDGRAALEVAEMSGSLYIYLTDKFVVEADGEYLIEDQSDNLAVRKLVKGSDDLLYFISDPYDPAVLPISVDDAQVHGRIIAEYVLKP